MASIGTVANKRWLYKALNSLAGSAPDGLGSQLASLYQDDALWRGSHPLNEAKGVAAIEATVWRPLRRSFPDLERRALIFVGGSYHDRDYVAALGHYCGTFREDYLTIPPLAGRFTFAMGKCIRSRAGRSSRVPAFGIFWI